MGTFKAQRSHNITNSTATRLLARLLILRHDAFSSKPRGPDIMHGLAPSDPATAHMLTGAAELPALLAPHPDINHTNFVFSSLNSTSPHITTGNTAKLLSCKRGKESTSGRPEQNTSQASGELLVTPSRTELWASPQAQRAHGRLENKRQANFRRHMTPQNDDPL